MGGKIYLLSGRITCSSSLKVCWIEMDISSSSPIIDGRIKKTFQGQVHLKIEDVQCFNCKELGHSLKYCTVVGSMVSAACGTPLLFLQQRKEEAERWTVQSSLVGFFSVGVSSPVCSAFCFFTALLLSRFTGFAKFSHPGLASELCPIASNIDYRLEEGFMESGYRRLSPEFYLKNAS